MRTLWAVVPVKDIAAAKQRLGRDLAASVRRALALAMLEDVLETLAAVDDLHGIVVATVDPGAAALGQRFGAVILRENAGAGHSEAVAAAAQALARERAAMLTIPADIPLVRPDDIARVIAASGAEPAFTIVPARDWRGSNAVLCAPADAVPLRFGGASFRPHLAAARARGLVPVTLEVPRIALDIDDADDLAAFLAVPSRTRAREVLLSQGAEAQP
jgi:2-phospho-L-lactate/phosphoenolpyruvate guanylyltransferase